MDPNRSDDVASPGAGVSRRDFVQSAMVGRRRHRVRRAGLGASSRSTTATPSLAQIAAQHDATVKMLQDWIALPSIAAENRNYPQGAGVHGEARARRGLPARRGRPDRRQAGRLRHARRRRANDWLGIYFMYDVKQYDPAEWSSPPLEGRHRRQAGRRQGDVGRGATNTKGPQMACLAALHAFKAARREAAGQPRARLRGRGGDRLAELLADRLQARGRGGAHASASASSSRSATRISTAPSQINLGAKGIVELELVSTGEKWGRGPKLDVHSSLAAQIDSPAWHLVQALNTLVKADGHTPAVEGFFDKVRPLVAGAEADPRGRDPEDERGRRRRRRSASSAGSTTSRGTTRSCASCRSRRSTSRDWSAATPGPGGKTILPHRAVAKIDMRLVPDMTAKGTLELLKAHLAKHGFGDIEVNMTGGYDPTETAPDSKLVQAQIATYRKAGIEPLLWPRLAGSWPGVTFTGAPLKLAGRAVRARPRRRGARA